ncbi:MAG: D-alanine--D-serine ligase VanG [Clostridia bacterium]
MDKKTIAVLFGGCSSEYEISLQSAYAVLTHIDPSKYYIIPVGISKTGEWFVYYGAYEKIPEDSWRKDKERLIPAMLSPDRRVRGIIEFYGERCHHIAVDAVFPVLHGKNGEDGTVQGLCELAGIPVIGCNSLSSALCMDKYRAHKLVQAEGVAVPESILITRGMTAEAVENIIAQLQFPMFIKPVRAGSSFGISKISSAAELPEALENAFFYDYEAIAEETIDGFEIGCAIIGSDNLTAGRVDEIELKDGFFDFTEKYTLKTSEIHMPARINAETEERIREIAKKIYRILGCSVFARVDLFLAKDGRILFNEINTIPGFTDHSRFPNMLKGIGMSFDEIVEAIVRCGLEN